MKKETENLAKATVALQEDLNKLSVDKINTTEDKEPEIQKISIEKKCKELGTKVLGVEGLKESRWVLIDAGDIIVHVFHDPIRAEYDIESLWNEAPRVELPFEQEQIAR